MSNYNTAYWEDRVKKYAGEAWSQQPSPFAKLISDYYKPPIDILELGTGAGQDGIYFASQGNRVTFSDATDVAFADIIAKLVAINRSADFNPLDINHKFPFQDGAFDMVYAQLVLHYFTDDEMKRIMAEIKRVLRPNGILACMVNSTSDPEYDPAKVGTDSIIQVGDLRKRYFDVKSFATFTEGFKPLLFDDKGKTPKDDAVDTSGMIRFVGVKK